MMISQTKLSAGWSNNAIPTSAALTLINALAIIIPPIACDPTPYKNKIK